MTLRFLFVCPVVVNGEQFLEVTAPNWSTTFGPYKVAGKTAALLYQDFSDVEYDYLVIVDADTNMRRGVRNETRRFVFSSALLDAKKPALATGERVFINHDTTLNQARAIWGKFSTGYLNHIKCPWGGMTFIRKDYLEHAKLVWNACFYDDLGWKSVYPYLEFVKLPGVEAYDASSVGAREFFDFLVRQYVGVRAYSNKGLLWFSWALCFSTLPITYYFPIWSLVSTICIYMLIACVMDESFFKDESPSDPLFKIRAVALLHLFNLFAVPVAFLKRSFVWHGVRHKI